MFRRKSRTVSQCPYVKGLIRNHRSSPQVSINLCTGVYHSGTNNRHVVHRCSKCGFYINKTIINDLKTYGGCEICGSSNCINCVNKSNWTYQVTPAKSRN